MKPIVYKSDEPYSTKQHMTFHDRARAYPVGTIIVFSDGQRLERRRLSRAGAAWSHFALPRLANGQATVTRTIYVCPHCEREIKSLADSGDEPNACAECGQLFVEPMERKV